MRLRTHGGWEDRRKKGSKVGSTEESGDRDRRNIFREGPRSQGAREKLGAVVLKGLLGVLI